MITQKLLKECFNYNEYTGDFTWIARPKGHFLNKSDRKSHETRCTGRVAGHILPSGYRCLEVGDKKINAHKAAFLYTTGSIPKIVDHIDGNKLNNSLSNLRACSHSSNMCNTRGTRKNNKSGFTGVSYDTARDKYMAKVNKNKKTKFSGRFDSKLEAARFRDMAAYIHHGQFANINLPCLFVDGLTRLIMD